MTGFLPRFTGPAQASDHEKRIRELEKRLKAKQTDLPRRPVVSTGTGLVAGILALNNASGDRDGSDNLVWDSAYAVGDRSWFDFPFGGDDAVLKITRPGIAVATLTFNSTPDPVDVRLVDNKTGIQAVTAAAVTDQTIEIAVPYYTSFGTFDPFDSATITADATGNIGDPVFAALSVVFYDDYPWAAVPGGWTWETTEGW